MTFRKGNIFLTCEDIGMWSQIPVMMMGRIDKTIGCAPCEGINCFTGTHVIVLEKEKLSPHGTVRKIKTYKTAKHYEFTQFEVNFGDEEYTVDVKMSDFCFKIDDLRIRAFVQALGKRAKQ